MVGVLQWATICLSAARIFLRRLYDLLAKALWEQKPYVKLSRGAQLDLRWWAAFWKKFDGVVFQPEDEWVEAESIGVFTDASKGSRGIE